MPVFNFHANLWTAACAFKLSDSKQITNCTLGSDYGYMNPLTKEENNFQVL